MIIPRLSRMMKGCYVETGDFTAGTGGADPAPAADPTPAADPATVKEVINAPGNTPTGGLQEQHGLSREDFTKVAPFLRKHQAGQNPEPGGQVKEGEPADTPPDAEPGKANEPEADTSEPPPAVFKLPDGREATLEQIAEWEKGHMMQKDYTLKTQKLAEERRRLEQEFGPIVADKEKAVQAFQLWEGLSRDPIGVLNHLLEHYAEQGIYEPKDPAELAREDAERRLSAERQKLQDEKVQIAVRDAYTVLDSQLNTLAEKHGDRFDRAAVEDFMVKNNFLNPEKAFEAVAGPVLRENLQKQIDELNNKLKTAGASAVNDYVKNKTSRVDTGPPLGGGGSGSPPVVLTQPKTFSEARKSAIARLAGE